MADVDDDDEDYPRYNLSDFDEWLLPDPGPPRPTGAALPFTVPGTVRAGARNDTLYRAARALHAKGLSPAALHAALSAENQARCVPPLPQPEVDQIAVHAATQADRPDFTPLSQLNQNVPPFAPLNQTALDDDALTDATVVAAEGRQIARDGVPFIVEDMIPNFGMLGMFVGFAKCGKTTFTQRLGAAVAMNLPFLGHMTHAVRVLLIAAEDPPEYTAYLARHLELAPGLMSFYRRSVLLDPPGLARIVETVDRGCYGLVLIASWQAVVRGLMRDENDNAGAAVIVEHVKAAARATGVPWLIDAHSGKGEDQSDDADPSRAMRGASAAAAAADFTLSIRYGNGPFDTRRRISGKGRFVSLAPLTVDFDPATSAYTVIGNSNATLTATTWELIQTVGALTTAPQSADTIARAIGLVSAAGRVTTTGRRQVRDALRGRDGVMTTSQTRRGQRTTLYRLTDVE